MPATHALQSFAPIAVEALPVGHREQLVLPSEGAYSPLAQSTQESEPPWPLYLPGGHLKHEPAPELEVVPLVQSMQEEAPVAEY